MHKYVRVEKHAGDRNSETTGEERKMSSEKDFSDVYHEYYGKVFRYVRGKITGYHDAEDLTQEIFAACYRNFESFDPEKASVGTWVYVIMNNRLKNYYRDKKEHVSLDDDENFLEPAAEEVLEEAILLEEQKRLLLEALESLSERERQIVMNTYFYKKSSAETAALLQMTAGNVRVVLNRSLSKIRTWFEEKGY